MTRFLNIVIVCMMATYFYLEYQKPNAAGAAQTDPLIGAAELATQEETVAKAEAGANETLVVIAPKQQNKSAQELVDDVTEMSVLEPVQEPEETAVQEPTQAVETTAIVEKTVTTAILDDLAEVEPQVEPQEVPQVIFRVTGSVVNARSGPGTQYQVLTRLRRGQELVATGETDGTWAKAVVSDTGEEVWMHTSFLDEVG